MVFTCMIMQHIHNTVFFFLECFSPKQQVIVKAKHRFLVQHASYSLREGGKLSFRHLISYRFLIKVCDDNVAVAVVHRFMLLHILLTKSLCSFYVCNSYNSAHCLPTTIGDLMGTTKHSKLLILGSGPAGIYRGGVCRTRKFAAGTYYRYGKGGQLTTTTEVENWPGDQKRLTGRC